MTFVCTSTRITLYRNASFAAFPQPADTEKKKNLHEISSASIELETYRFILADLLSFMWRQTVAGLAAIN